MVEEDLFEERFKEQKDKLDNSMVHPLLNPNSSHYCMFDGLQAIEILEQLMTPQELMAWCRGNIYKYRLRVGNKDSDGVSDLAKIETYENYYNYLKDRFDEEVF